MIPRAAVPLEHQPLSSGALGTPDRNHTCPDCRGLGEVSIYPCQRCLGAGELTADGTPELRAATRKDWRDFAAVRVLRDAVVRRKVSKARASGKLGLR